MAFATSTVLAGLALATAAGSAYQTAQANKQNKNAGNPFAPALPKAPAPVDPTAAITAKRKKGVGTGSSGRAGTLLTGPQGLTDSAPTQRKTLLGS